MLFEDVVKSAVEIRNKYDKLNKKNVVSNGTSNS
jgi:hypothetical protein